MFDDIPTATILEMYYAELEHQGYSKSELAHNRVYGNGLLKYAERKGVSFGFVPELGYGYLLDCYGINHNARCGEIKKREDLCRLRFCEKLASFCKGEPFKYSYLSHDNYPLPEQFSVLAENFYKSESESPQKTLSTALQHYRIARRFLHYAVTQGAEDCRDINSSTVNGWVLELEGLSPATAKTYCSGLGVFFTWLCKSGNITEDLSQYLPAVRLWRLSKIPSVWQEGDLSRLLNSVDRGSPTGKRDYAILLLAAGLGLRASDIKTLKMQNLKWRAQKGKSTIELTQYKTGQPVSLPLSTEIGNAIIDYLKNGRPASSSPFVFLRHNAPFKPFGPDVGMGWIIDRYAKKAGIELSPAAKHGMHSLRHTFASSLVAGKAPIESVAGLLGHMNTQTAHIYIKVDIEGLRECALSPSEVIPDEKD